MAHVYQSRYRKNHIWPAHTALGPVIGGKKCLYLPWRQAYLDKPLHHLGSALTRNEHGPDMTRKFLPGLFAFALVRCQLRPVEIIRLGRMGHSTPAICVGHGCYQPAACG